MASRANKQPWWAGVFGVLLLVAVVSVGGLTWAWFHRTPILLTAECVATSGGFSGSLEPDQARNAALISAIAVKRGLPARAATIALATAAQESKLRNIEYGDRDSLGLFQQRPSQGWGTKEQVLDPEYSTNKFYDHLVRIKGYETMPITKAAQAVQRSGFPEAYAQHENESRAMAAAFYGQFPHALTCSLPVAKAAKQAAGSSGYTAQADTVLATVGKDFGSLPAKPADGGATLEFTFPDTPTGHQRAWGLAHWAVASADALHITDVRTDSRRWSRTNADGGWAATENVPASRVRITVANG